MSLEIKKAHLQYVYTLMATPLKYPQFFYAQADIFFWFFKRLDEKTTYRAIVQKKNANIEPSYFGEKVIEFANRSFITKQTDPADKEAIKRFSRDTFLNLAAWYLCPLIEANNHRCPYMPQSWIVSFFKEKAKSTPEDLQKYLVGIFALMNRVEDKSWMRPYRDIASQLGKNDPTKLLLLVSMFLEAYEKEKNQMALPSPEKPMGDATKNLSPEVIDFLEGLDLTDFPEKK